MVQSLEGVGPESLVDRSRQERLGRLGMWTTAVVVAVLTSAIERHDERRSARKAREGQPEGHHAWQPWHPHAPWRPHIQEVRHRADHISDHNAGAGD